MSTRMIVLAYSMLLAVCLAVPGSAASQDEAALKKDLTSVIALQGLPCGEVVSVQVLAQNDYGATCKDGNKYHVYQNAKGRVVVDKR